MENNGSGNYGNKHIQYGDKKSCGKQDSYKGKKDFDKKPWHNKDQKLWNKDQKSDHGNKESKPGMLVTPLLRMQSSFVQKVLMKVFSMQ